MSSINTDVQRIEFFEAIFGTHEGYLCIAHAPATKRAFLETYFKWPAQAADIIAHINSVAVGHNVWFGGQLLWEPKRNKINVQECYALWADLDECVPGAVEPINPPVTLQTSNGRWQGFWPLKDSTPALIAEDLSCRIARANAERGVDQSGWDLSQLLRVPYTHNYKYPERPLVSLDIQPIVCDLESFLGLPKVENRSIDWIDPPDRIFDPQTVLQDNLHKLEPWLVKAIEDPIIRDGDWSSALWHIERSLFEVGLSREEVYAVVTGTPCNKFARDGHPERLWWDVLRAEKKILGENTFSVGIIGGNTPPELNIDMKFTPGIVEKYVEWGQRVTDAPKQYHEAAAFMLLSTMCSSSLKLETSMGDLKTNLWIIILGETTITRKSTAMRYAKKIMDKIDEDIILATEEGSPEGILEALRSRPGRTSLFYRDEVLGLIKGTAKKDYLAGLLELMTKLYDGDDVKRHLRKETITVRDPVFSILAGGIRNAFHAESTDEHLFSGFFPRFLFVMGSSSIDQMKPLGPKRQRDESLENELYEDFKKIYDNYTRMQNIQIGSQTLGRLVPVMADLTDDAWVLWNDIYSTYIKWASDHPMDDTFMPIMNRSCMSMLKMATLLAAARQEPDIVDRISVESEDIAHAVHYWEPWIPYSIQVVERTGITANERLLDRVLHRIRRQPGVSRSELLVSMRLDSRVFRLIVDTLEQRMQIQISKSGKAELYYAVPGR
jgi:hypothetical protein